MLDNLIDLISRPVAIAEVRAYLADRIGLVITPSMIEQLTEILEELPAEIKED